MPLVLLRYTLSLVAVQSLIVLKYTDLCVWVFCLDMYLWAACVPGALGDQKIGLDPLELELQKIVRGCLDVGNQTQVFWESS